ncbi:hypothetical protein [Succinimonas sp.]|uniref:hypothetical protein n=1 Tax=Succinimonas sp. TaxID=1936151 RepID=UPI00386AF213
MVYDVVVINVQIVINVNTSHFAFLFYSAPAQRHRSGKDSFDPGAVQQKKSPWLVNIKTKKPADCYTFADYCGKLQKFDPGTLPDWISGANPAAAGGIFVRNVMSFISLLAGKTFSVEGQCRPGFFAYNAAAALSNRLQAAKENRPWRTV